MSAFLRALRAYPFFPVAFATTLGVTLFELTPDLIQFWASLPAGSGIRPLALAFVVRLPGAVSWAIPFAGFAGILAMHAWTDGEKTALTLRRDVIAGTAITAAVISVVLFLAATPNGNHRYRQLVVAAYGKNLKELRRLTVSPTEIATPARGPHELSFSQLAVHVWNGKTDAWDPILSRFGVITLAALLPWLAGLLVKGCGPFGRVTSVVIFAVTMIVVYQWFYFGLWPITIVLLFIAWTLSDAEPGALRPFRLQLFLKLARAKADIGGVLLVGVLGVGMIVITAILLFDNVRETERQRISRLLMPSWEFENVPSAMVFGDPYENKPLLYIRAEHFDYREMTLSLQSTLLVPRFIWSKLRDRDGQSVVDLEAKDVPPLRPRLLDRFSQERFTLLFEEIGGASSTLRSQTFEDFARMTSDSEYPWSYEVRFDNVTISPVEFSNTSYPSDEYRFLTHVYLRPTARLSLTKVEDLLMGYVVMKGNRMNLVRIESARRPPNSQEISLRIRRETRFVVFVYVMSFVPFGFGLMVWHQLFLRQADKRPATELLATVIAAILTVLPLRQVLVPPEIQGVTRVDLLLGFGVAVALGGVFVRYALDARHQLTRAQGK